MILDGSNSKLTFTGSFIFLGHPLKEWTNWVSNNEEITQSLFFIGKLKCMDDPMLKHVL